MGSKYVSNTQTGYNVASPSDDGAMTAQNAVTWTGIKTKLGDPTLTLAQNINTSLVTALDFSGRSISGNDTCTAADHMFTIECTGTLTATLVDCTVGAGFIVSYSNIGSGVVTVNLANAANTLNGTVNGTDTIPAGGFASYKVNKAGTGFIAYGVNSYTATAALGNDTKQVATTAFAQHMQSPAFTGTPTAPTAAPNTNTTQIATTAYADAISALKANLSGGNTITGTQNLTGAVVNVATQAVSDNSTLAASTAMVQSVAFNSALPAQTGNAGKYVTTNGTNASWAYPGVMTVGSTITANTTLTAASAGYQPFATTALGQSVTLPDATTMGLGGPKYILDNTKGTYPVGVRDSTGTLLMGIAAGGEGYVALKDNSTAAGVWSITGTNLEAGLITIDNTFSATYTSTVYIPFVALDSNKSIHFLSLTNGFAAVAVDNTTLAVGTPVTVTTTPSSVPRAVFKITSTTAIVFYSDATNTLIGVVISLSGATTLSVGTPSATLTATGCGVEDSFKEPKIAQLDTTLYLVSYATATGAGTTSVAAFQVSGGTTVNLGSAVNIIAASNVLNSTTTYTLTTTTGLVIYLSGTARDVNAVVVSVTNANPPVCTVNTPASSVGSQTDAFSPSSCLLSSTKAIVFTEDSALTLKATAITVSAGTTVTFGTPATVETLSVKTGAANYIADNLSRSRPHLFALSASTALLNYIGDSSISRVLVLSESAGAITPGTIYSGTFCLAAADATGNGLILPQGTSEVCAIYQLSNSASAYATDSCIVPYKINGTTITSGSTSNTFSVPTSSVYLISATRLSTEVYVILTSSEGAVFRTNGVSVARLGVIKTPLFYRITALAGVTFSHAVSSNRLVYIGSQDADTRSRLINMEVAQ